MARLNDPAAPTETLESLKRKFMRQNRDIARANSTQSLRIRNLENEVSRLLADNLGLREQILRLQSDLETRQAQRAADHTGAVKSQLEAKLLELGELINGLGNATPPKKKSPRPGTIMRASPGKSPDQKNWKNICAINESVGGQEGRLPPILENKSYPRKTLERDEIVHLVVGVETDTTDSPEIGPPPVSQFVDEDPVKIDLPKRSRKDDNEDLSGLDPALSINLEQRRKRKDSIVPSDAKRPNKVEVPQVVREAGGSLKTGAKRKLSVRDDEESGNAALPRANSPDDFKFTRVTTEERTKNITSAQSDRSVNRVARNLAGARGATREKQSVTTAPPGRKVLAPKSINDSPRKTSRSLVVDEVKLAKAEIPKSVPARERSKEKRLEPVQIQPLSVAVMSTVEVQPAPETPAALDIFSPLLSQSSAAGVGSQDTPPPAELGPGNEGQRPSRRSRGAVSYAEPNLRDKMRRPTKELVDAVSKDDKAHRDSAVKLEEDAAPNFVSIKAEHGADDSWKKMPAALPAVVENSPRSSKAPDSLPSSITTHRKRRESLLNQPEPDVSRSSSGSAIAALLAENRKAKVAAKEKQRVLDDEEAAVTNAMAKLDIYEFKGSPLHETEPAKNVKEEKAASRNSRRYSSVPRDIANVTDSEASDMEAPRKQESMCRRRQSTLGMKAPSTSQDPVNDAGSEKTLKKAVSSTGITDVGNSGSRSDRIAARRSMML